MLRQVVSWQSYTATSSKGDKTYAAASDINCYQVGKRKLLINTAGQQIYSNVHLFVDELVGPTLKTGDLIKPINSTVYFPILFTEPFYKENGILDYVIVYL